MLFARLDTMQVEIDMLRRQCHPSALIESAAKPTVESVEPEPVEPVVEPAIESVVESVKSAESAESVESVEPVFLIPVVDFVNRVQQWGHGSPITESHQSTSHEVYDYYERIKSIMLHELQEILEWLEEPPG